MTSIEIDKSSVFPYFNDHLESRIEAFDYIHRQSYRTGTLVLPPREGEFMYIWSKFILPEPIMIEVSDDHDFQETFNSFFKNTNLKNFVDFSSCEDHDLADQIVVCAMIAAYNARAKIRNHFARRSEGTVQKYADFFMPLYNHLREPENARFDVGYFYEFSYSYIIKVGSKIILDAKEALSNDDKASFWDRLLYINDNSKKTFTTENFRRKVLSKPILLYSQRPQDKFIIDEYQEREDSEFIITKAQIISMLENTDPSTKTLNLILEALERCQ